MPALDNFSQSIASSGAINHTPERAVGVNYLSTYHLYSAKYTTNAALNRDFSKFNQDGISVINLSLYWYRLEGNTRGSYNGTLPDGSYYGDRFLDDVKRVTAIANQYGIKVQISFHTLWGNDDSPWCTPNYVIDPVTGNNTGLAIVRSDEMRQAFIAMFTHAVTYLAGTPGIMGWAILNEPWYWGRTSNEHDFITNNGQTQKENFITLFQELSNIVKTLDGRPTTVRFCNTHTWTDSDGTPHLKNIFVEDWGWDQRIFNALDFISLNAYMPPNSQLETTWRTMTSINVLESSEKNKQVWVAEFGLNSSDEREQADAFEHTMSFYASLPISGIVAWQWTSGIVSDANSQSSWNICADGKTGSGKPAYEILTTPL